MEKNQMYCEDEIDLKELVNLILRKKLTILLITAFFTLISLIYVFIKTPIYEVKSNVKVGYIGKNLVDKPGVIVKTLKVIFNVDEPDLLKENYTSKVSSVSVNKKLKDFIVIKTEGTSNEEALQKNKEVVSYLKELYFPKIQQYKVEIENQISNLEKNIEELNGFTKEQLIEKIKKVKNQEIKKIDEKISFYLNIQKPIIGNKIKFHEEKLLEYEKALKQIYDNNKSNQDKVIGTISAIQMVNYQNLILNSQNKIEDLRLRLEQIDKEIIPDLERKKSNIKSENLKKLEHKLNVELPNKITNVKYEIEQLKFKMSKQNVQNSHVVGDYIIKNHPVKPKKKLILAIGFIAGFIFAVFWVLMLNYFKEENIVDKG